MYITAGGLQLHFEEHEGEGIPTLLLHGWGASAATMQSVFNRFVSQNKSIIALDLPHFGLSPTPPSGFDIYDYANTVLAFLDEKGIEKVNLLAHSFGGRIALLLASDQPDLVAKMVITGGAGLKPKRGMQYHFKVLLYKIKKKLGKTPKDAGSPDYQNLPDDMKGVFIRVVNTFLDKYLSQIKCPTLLLWGKDDNATPLWMGKKMQKSIKDSGLVVLENAGHYAFLDNFSEFMTIVEAFL